MNSIKHLYYQKLAIVLCAGTFNSFSRRRFPTKERAAFPTLASIGPEVVRRHAHASCRRATTEFF